MGPEGICGLWRHALIALVAVRGEHGARHSVQQRALHAHLRACVCNTRVPQRSVRQCPRVGRCSVFATCRLVSLCKPCCVHLQAMSSTARQ